MVFIKLTKKIKENVSDFARFFVLGVVFSSLLLVAACSDQGCIEADDFGEYESQTLEIPANNADGACDYDVTKPITDALQGSGLKTCFISGTVTIYDEEGVSQVSTTGCRGLPDLKFRNICINQCISDCNSKIGTSGADTPEPSWIATGYGKTLKIKSNAQIFMRAIGNVSLGDKFTYPGFYISPNDFMAQSNKIDWTKQIIDVKPGKSFNINFSGKFYDSTPLSPSGGAAVGQIGNGDLDVMDKRIYNAQRRLVAYVQPSPTAPTNAQSNSSLTAQITGMSGYDFEVGQTDEKLGSINIPILPDANLWTCSYDATGTMQQANCSNKSYRNNGYPKVDDVTVNTYFPVISTSKSESLAKYGGIVRWDGDGLKPDNYNPFAAINCDSGTCPGASSIDSQEGKIVGDILTAESSPISVAAASDVSFKYLLTSPQCNGSIDLTIKNSSGTIILTKRIDVNNAVWSNHLNNTNSAQNISLEGNQQIVIATNTQDYLNASGGRISCGNALAVKFSKYHDVQIQQSGMVSFAMLGGATTAGCVVKGRIVNPQGSHLDDPTGGYTADFYEYERFDSALRDPLRTVAVPAIPAIGGVWYTDNVNNGSNKIFVRKGQVLRFSPESWNATWNTVSGARECGIGMAMRIEPRPAFLCRSYVDDYITTLGCKPKIIGSTIVGCDENSYNCTDPALSSEYCPSPNCYQPITCDNGVAPNFQRTNCQVGPVPSGCVLLGAELNNCRTGCADKRRMRAETPLFTSSPGLAKCYNLEEYRGKVDNIPQSGYMDADFSTPSMQNKIKGLTKIPDFNGQYGTFGNFSNSGKKDPATQNILYQASQPLNISQAGRLKFMLLDGRDFIDIGTYYGDNTSAGTGYNGANGFKIDVSSFLEFNNGEWLEAKLCQDLAEANGQVSTTCRDMNISAGNLVPKPGTNGSYQLVDLADPVGNNFSAQATGTYKFDPFGTLTRFRAPDAAGECINSLTGDIHFCHTATVNASNLRITFKIKDPERYDCVIPDGSNSPTTLPNGIQLTNTKYRASDCSTGGSGALNGVTEIDANTHLPICVANNSAGQTCNLSDGPDCKKEFRCVNKYANNSGKYYVTVRVKDESSTVSNIVDAVVSPVIEVMDGKKDKSTIGQAERIYKMIINDPRYQAILTMSLVLMYSFYGLGYLMGITDATVTDLVQKVLKISIIYLFVGPQGWEWFDKIVVSFFKNSTDYISFLMASSFDNSPSLKNAINNYDFYDKSILFSSVDKVFGIIFSATVMKKLAALLFASIFGWAYLLIIYYGVVLYIFAVGNAILLYLTSQVFISILFVLGPLFFIFTLFNQTKEMFDKWLQQLIGFSLQQIFLLTTLAFFNMMMYEVIKMVLGYKICWDEVWTINIMIRITLMSFWTIASLPPRTTAQSDVGNIGNGDGVPSFFSILFIWAIAKLMHQFVSFMTDLAASISGGLKASELGSSLKKATEGVGNYAGKWAGEAWGKTGGETVRKLDKALFDSGAKASAERKQRKLDISKDKKNRRAMTSDGNKAVSNYKKENAESFSKLSKADQEAKLKEVRDKAIDAKGEKLGLSPADIKRLKDSKGFTYQGDNVFGAALHGTKQSLFSGGNLGSSMNEQKIKTAFSSKEAKEAIKKAGDDEARTAIIDAAKQGKIAIKDTGVTKTVAKTLAKPFANLAKDVAKASGLSKLTPGNGEFDKARNQLVKEGEISKMASGTNWSRSDDEKKKIRERMKQNIQQKQGDKMSASSASAIASMQLQSNIAKDLENKGTSNSRVREEGVLSSIIGREKTVGGAWDRYTERKKIAKEISESRGSVIEKGLDTRLAATKGELGKAQNKHNQINTAIKNIEGDKNFQDKSAKLAEAAQKSTDSSLTKDERQAASLEVDKLNSDKVFSRQRSELDRAYASSNQVGAKVQNLTKQRDSISDNLNAVRTSSAIKSAIKDIKENPLGKSVKDVSDARSGASEYRDIMSKDFSGDQASFQKIQKFNKDYAHLLPKKDPTAAEDNMNPNLFKDNQKVGGTTDGDSDA